MKKLQAILARLREPSTAAGLSVLGMLVGLPPGSVDATLAVLSGGAAVLAIVLPEKKPEPVAAGQVEAP